MPDDKDITIITTIHPASKGRPARVTVTAAPDGEMPLMLSGQFGERHQLADQLYGQLLKRKPQVPKGTAAKAEPAPSKPAKADDADKPGNGTAIALGLLPDEAADPMGPATTESQPAESPNELPMIEGDVEPEPELEG